MPANLNFRLKSLLAIGELTLEGMTGDESLLLSLILLGMFRLLVLLQVSPSHAAPPNISTQADLTFESVIPQVTVLDVSIKMCPSGECLVTRECVFLIVAWRWGPGAGVAAAEVDSLAMFLHVFGLREALSTIRALVRA